MDSKDVADYYDAFVEEQQSSGVNDRIFKLYKLLKKLRLNSHSSVLELGCGVGTMTYLLSRVVTKGRIEAVDISPKSIAFCKKRIKKKNIRFIVGDIVCFSPSIPRIDFITLFDVIEHIPVEKHGELFRNLSRFCDAHTRIVINIPNPDYIQYDQEHHPEALQIIDQPIHLDFIVENLTRNNLELIYFKSYSVWVKNDYQLFIVKKKENFKELLLSDRMNILQKAAKKMQRLLIRVRYRYP